MNADLMAKKLLRRLKEEIRRRNYSYSTEKNYSLWIKRYVRFHNLVHPLKLDEKYYAICLHQVKWHNGRDPGGKYQKYYGMLKIYDSLRLGNQILPQFIS